MNHRHVIVDRSEILKNTKNENSKLRKLRKDDLVRYEQLKKKYDTLHKMFAEIRQELYLLKMYAPGLGTEYFKAKEEFEGLQKKISV